MSISNRIDGRNIVAGYIKRQRRHEQQFANDRMNGLSKYAAVAAETERACKALSALAPNDVGQMILETPNDSLKAGLPQKANFNVSNLRFRTPTYIRLRTSPAIRSTPKAMHLN